MLFVPALMRERKAYWFERWRSGMAAKETFSRSLSEKAKVEKIRHLLNECIDKFTTITGMAIYDRAGQLQVRDLKQVGVPAPLQEEYYSKAGLLLKWAFQDIGQMRPGVGGYRGDVAEDLGAVSYIRVVAANRQFGITPLDEDGWFVLVGICSDPRQYIPNLFHDRIMEMRSLLLPILSK